MNDLPLRHEPPRDATEAVPAARARPAADSCTACGDPTPPARALPPPDPRVQRLRIAAMDCASEEAEIRGALRGVPDIRRLTFNLSERSLRIDAPSEAAVAAMAAIRRIGFEVEFWPDAAESDARRAPALGKADHALAGGLAHPLLALALATAAELLSFFAPGTLPFKTAGLALAATAIALAGFGVFRKGLAALRVGRLNINALMTAAVTGAFVIGQWPEAAMVMALYAIAELIEARAVDRARNAISGLLAMAPEEAAVRQPDGTWVRHPVAAVPLDAVVRVGPGERVPMDGVVAEGMSAVDQASLTGESIPVDKGPGDMAFAGTINISGTLSIRVTAAATNSTLARIIDAVEQAQASRAPTQRFVDRFAAVYTPSVFVLALAIALLGPWLLGWPWLSAIYKALVLLVIACPCALVISTPVTVVSGLAAAARRGILIKGGVHLEQARLIKAVAFDKTGTLTEGKPRLVHWSPLEPAADKARIERIAAALAAHSDHPVARAIAAGLSRSSSDAKGFTALAGRGIQAEIGGEPFILGNHRLIEERGQCSTALESMLRSHEEAGRTVSVLAANDGALALFAVADTLKPTSRQAIAELGSLGIRPVMLTGDNQVTALAIAREIGLADVRGNLLPEEKLAAIKSLQSKVGPTAMAGDGINDAPALAQADIGVAMGAAGTDIAMEAADVVVMNDDLRRIAETVRLSRRTHAVLWQNISLALGIKALFLGLAIFDNASMWMAVFADMGASLLVVANGLRLLRARAGGRPVR